MGDATFPRTAELPDQSPVYWVGQKDRYLRQQLIRDIEAITKRRFIVYFANRFAAGSDIADDDPIFMTELLTDVAAGDEVDLLIETNGGKTDSTEALVSLLQNRIKDLRVVVANAAKSNGTLVALTGKTIVMGPSSELGPIDPHLNGIPCTVLSQPQVAVSNFPLQQLAELGLKQTRKLATKLLRDGMLKGKDDAVIDDLVRSLATRETYFSHGSTIDHLEAERLGLNITALEIDDPVWRRIWLLYTMYDFDSRRDGYLKIFEGRALSTAVAQPPAPPIGAPPASP